MRIAIVTGAARGIGAATARALAAEKIGVALLDLDIVGVEHVAAEIRAAGGQARGFGCDVGKKASVEAAIAFTAAQLGEPGILVNNAGIGGPFHRVDEVSDEEWELIVATNLKSVFLFSRALLPKMKLRGYGRIINIASIQGLLGSARSSTYVATKHGMLGYTKALAAEWGEFGITINAICPGYVDTAMGAKDGKVDGYLAKVLKKTPVGRVARPDEIASLAVYLSGDHSGYINGASFVIDGGMTAHVGIT